MNFKVSTFAWFPVRRESGGGGCDKNDHEFPFLRLVEHYTCNPHN